MLIFLITIIVIYSILTGFMVVRMQKLDFVKKIKNKALYWLVSFLPAILIVIVMRFNVINCAIVTYFLALIWGLFKLLFIVIEKVAHKKVSETILAFISIIITAIYLGNAYYVVHHVVQTNYTLYTDKNIGTDNFRIVQVSDSHVGATMNGEGFSKYMERINETNPDIVVITGDFVDDDTLEKDMIKACEGLGKLKTKYGVYYVFGNHDKGYFTYRTYGTEELVNELRKNNVIVLEDQIYKVTNEIYIIGRKDKSEKSRLDISELASKIDSSKYIIDLNHQPNDYKNEAAAGVDLVLSGHTHGGQFFPLGPFGVLFGANDSYYGLQVRDNTNFIVNSGLGDWAIKFKTGTVSEYGVIDIKPNK